MSENKRHAPGFALRFLKWFCPPSLYEGIEGDLLEKFEEDVNEIGERKARRRLIWNIIRFFRPGILLRNKILIPLNQVDMIRHHIKVAYRHTMKARTYSLINVLGLAVGIASAFLIFNYVYFERSYDRFYEHAEEIYRVTHDRYIDGERQYSRAQAFIPTGEMMKNEFPEVLDFVTLFKISEQKEMAINHHKQDGSVVSFSSENVFHTRGDFFRFFSFPIVSGKLDSAGLAPGTVFISESMAKKFFGSESPLDKVINYSNNKVFDFKVAGVFADFPLNSHLKIDFLLSWLPVGGEDEMTNWDWDGFFTYIKLAPGSDAGILEQKFPAFVAKYMGERRNQQTTSAFHLQSLTDIHLNSHLLGESEQNGDARLVKILTVLAVFILIIAYFNYINICTARSLERAKEIGIRKTAGSSRMELVKQFLIESLLINMLAAGAGIVLIYLFSKPYHAFTGIVINPNLFWNHELSIGFVSILFFGTICSALYPAFVISSFKPVKVLKKLSVTHSGLSFNLRRGMVTFQFATSITLIIGAIAFHKQTYFMKNHDLGLDIEQTLIIKTFASFGPPGSDSLFLNQLHLLKEDLLRHGSVSAVATSYDIPGKEHLSRFATFRKFNDSDVHISLFFTRIDPDFIPAFNARVLAGNNFSSVNQSNNEIIINVEALHLLGFDKPEDAVNAEIIYGREHLNKVRIVGVVDFRTVSLKEYNYPVVYQTYWAPMKFLSVRIEKTEMRNFQQTIALVEQNWKRMFPDKPFEYFFLDDLFNRQYATEQVLTKCLTLFTGLAIFVACLGLYGLSSVVLLQRTKEIGIRKILGATLANLFVLLSKEYVRLIILASIVAIPVVNYFLSRWLSGYPYRTDLPWWIFIAPCALMLLVTILTISYRIVRAMVTNPVESLRYE